MHRPWTRGRLKQRAITLNPYLGYEAIEPFLIDPDHAVFLLCKSSNPGAADLQEALLYNGEKFYELVAQLAQKWNQKGNIGLVVGATYPDSLARVRIKAPDMWILAPGIGTQGGDIKATLHVGLREDGLGLLVNVSRSISRSENPRNAALEIREAINKER